MPNIPTLQEAVRDARHAARCYRTLILEEVPADHAGSIASYFALIFRGTRQRDMGEPEIMRHAEILAAYYGSLIQEGVAAGEAEKMTCQYVTALVEKTGLEEPWDDLGYGS
jgi:hypothetical protein